MSVRVRRYEYKDHVVCEHARKHYHTRTAAHRRCSVVVGSGVRGDTRFVRRLYNDVTAMSRWHNRSAHNNSFASYNSHLFKTVTATN